MSQSGTNFDMTHLTREQCLSAIATERTAARMWLKSIGCLFIDSIVQEFRVIADKLDLTANFESKRYQVLLNGQDLSHVFVGFKFSYIAEHNMCLRTQGKGDFPICELFIKRRPFMIGQSVFREDEHLMRSGVVLFVQSDDTRIFIKNRNINDIHRITIDYNEDSGLELMVDNQSFSRITERVSVEADFRGYRIRVRNLGLKWT